MLVVSNVVLVLSFLEGELHKLSFVNQQLENVVKDDKIALMGFTVVQVQCKFKDKGSVKVWI